MGRKHKRNVHQGVTAILSESSGQENTPKKMRLNENDVTQKLSENEGELFDLRCENSRLKAELAKSRGEIEKMREEIAEVRYMAQIALKKANDAEQWGRQWNLRIWGITGDSLRENVPQCIDRVLSFIRIQLRLTQFPRDSIEVAHRLGRYQENSHRPIIVRFLRRTDCLAVLQQRRELRGTPYRLSEDLTRQNVQLLRRAQEAAGRRNAWSRGGDVFVRLPNGRKMQIHENTPVHELLDDQEEKAASPPTARQAPGNQSKNTPEIGQPATSSPKRSPRRRNPSPRGKKTAPDNYQKGEATHRRKEEGKSSPAVPKLQRSDITQRREPGGDGLNEENGPGSTARVKESPASMEKSQNSKEGVL